MTQSKTHLPPNLAAILAERAYRVNAENADDLQEFLQNPLFK